MKTIEKIKKIKELRFTPSEKYFYDFIRVMTHRLDSDFKYKEEWFYGHYNHIFTYDTNLNKVRVWTGDNEWKKFDSNFGSFVKNIKDKRTILEQYIKTYFNCDEVEFFYNDWLEKEKQKRYEIWTESYNEVLNR